MKVGKIALALYLVGTPAHALDAARLEAAARAEEAALGARVGAAVIDTRTGERWGWRADERFPLISTHKAYACAALLTKVDAGEASLDKRVLILPTDIVPYSPVTETKLAPQTMSLAELCAAAIGVSDNTAGNEVLAAIGGPPGLTGYFRTLGDATSQLDRNEPDLNEALPGDPRDTTTPANAAADLDKLILGDALKPTSRERLKQWMFDDKVSAPLLRAAFPADWRVADKTGAGSRGARAIVAVIYPPDRAPLVAAVYLTETTAPLDARNAAIRRIGEALKAALNP